MKEVIDFKIQRVEPSYSKTQLGGHFDVYLLNREDYPVMIKFAGFLASQMAKDTALREWAEKYYNSKTASELVYELIDIGYPLEEKLHEYIIELMDSSQARVFMQLLDLFSQFGSSSSGSLSEWDLF